MSGYTIKRLDEVDDIFGGRYPGIMRMLSEPLGATQVAITHRYMTPQSGGKGGYGHRHKTQEEVYFVVSGTLEFKLDDEVLELRPFDAIRIHRDTMRNLEGGPDGAELILYGAPNAGPGDVQMSPGWWSD